MPGNPFYQSSFWKALRARVLERDGWVCVVPGCGKRASFVDHIVARPRGLEWACPADRMENLRSLCAEHDAQVKEGKDGVRRSGGEFSIKGSDGAGMPLDPKHPWNLED